MKTIAPQIRRASAAPNPAPSIAHAPVELRIDAVVFHGFSRADGHRATAALQRELTRLVTTHGIAEFSGDGREQLDAGSIIAGPQAEMTGTRAARAIHGGLRG